MRLVLSANRETTDGTLEGRYEFGVNGRSLVCITKNFALGDAGFHDWKLRQTCSFISAFDRRERGFGVVNGLDEVYFLQLVWYFCIDELTYGLWSVNNV